VVSPDFVAKLKADAQIPEELGWLESVQRIHHRAVEQGTTSPSRIVLACPTTGPQPRLQGPFLMFPQASEASEEERYRACALLVLPTFPVILAIADAVGSVVMGAVMSEIRPQWTHSESISVGFDQRIYVPEEVDLQFPESSRLLSFVPDPEVGTTRRPPAPQSQQNRG
jgi:hypothetical protein